MGKRPLLKPRAFEANLKSLGFVHARTVGSQKQYVQATDGVRKKAVVTVDVGKVQFSKELMKNMIRQSLFTQEEFCSGDLNGPPPLSEPVTEGDESA